MFFANFELPRTSASGHREHTGAALDVGATLAGSSDETIGLMIGMSARSLTALGHCLRLSFLGLG